PRIPGPDDRRTRSALHQSHQGFRVLPRHQRQAGELRRRRRLPPPTHRRHPRHLWTPSLRSLPLRRPVIALRSGETPSRMLPEILSTCRVEFLLESAGFSSGHPVLGFLVAALWDKAPPCPSERSSDCLGGAGFSL